MSSVSFLSYGFMRNALIAVLLICPLFGILGTMIVSRKMAFFSDALGHSALTGVAIGLVFGISDTNLSMAIFAVVFALALNRLRRRANSSNDTIISVFSSASLAIGLAILSKGGSFSKYSALLVGDILSITHKELIYLGVIFACTLLFWIGCSNQLTAISLHVTLAKSRNIKVNFLEDIFAVLVALVVMVTIKWIGILIINAMLILPAASSANISSNIREYHFFSVVFAMFSGVSGLMCSYYTNVATGPMIVIIASMIYFGSCIYTRIYE